MPSSTVVPGQSVRATSAISVLPRLSVIDSRSLTGSVLSACALRDSAGQRRGFRMLYGPRVSI